MKVIFVDGSQMVGKSTLLEGLSKKYGLKVYKFPFSKYATLMNFGKEDLRGFQVGKDFSALYWLGQISELGGTILVDRGPMSTAYYSLACNRMSHQQIETFISSLSGFGSNFIYLFITAKNRPNDLNRNKNDGFDNLREGESEAGVLELLKKASKKANINFIHFENDFDISINSNLEKLCNLIGGEL